MNTIFPTTELKTFLAELGLANARLQRIQAGRNSRVWRVENGDEIYIVKEYFRHPSDPRDRLETEFGFLSFLQSQGILHVPQPLARQTVGDRALYSYLPGSPVPVIQAEHIKQAATLIEQINYCKADEKAQQLPLASEACLNISEHLDRVKIRLTQLQTAVSDGTDEVRFAVRNLLTESLIPSYQKFKFNIHNQLSKNNDVSLNKTQQILSPSDFGFHNILNFKSQLYFLDFEYAGWDDPAKLLCDFACQPERPVTASQSIDFQAHLQHLEVFASAWRRTKLLLPLYRLKWCCILLNEFRSQERERRDHAGVDSTDRLHLQLEKAQAYFKQHLQEYNATY
ncbi:MAG: aminoglycoside phosphotransferase family protein [Jaaginema sp. PMC 1079.18]|nr:aminoglycoside phosphotransferase family protein [Jaaginema sp. PMC 1080.18]MEC4850870.1 aminoglycoside phosphotransferase family protein [Jaaginema sp. PMC 1079.18]